MRKYLLTAYMQMFRQMSYRVNFITKIVTNLMGIITSVFTWWAVYVSSGKDVIAGMSFSQMVVYLCLTQVSTLIFNSTGIMRMGAMVRDGSLTTNLIRPYSIYGESMAYLIGQNLPMIFLYVIFIIIYSFVNRSFIQPLVLILLLVVNIWMYYTMTVFIGNFGFWMVVMWPLRGIMNGLHALASGSLFPLSLLPKGWQTFFEYSPFSLIGYRYTQAIQGLLSARDLVNSLLAAFIWGVVFSVGYKYSLERGLERFEGVGA